MREILYRAWIIPEKRMIYMASSTMDGTFGLHAIERWLHGITVIEQSKKDGRKYWAVQGYDWPTAGNPTDFCILMQYVNIKDKNDHRIFDGDILRLAGTRITAKVALEAPMFKGLHVHLVWLTNSIGDFLPGESVTESLQVVGVKEFEIIGNIYDNPELLK